MCLRFIFLLITHVTSWLRLSHREDAWKTTEILILRHQLAVQQRRQLRRPNLNWTDRPTSDSPEHQGTGPRLARENPEWGYRRIHGELASLGMKVAASTAWEILKNAGIDPPLRRSGLTWPQFLRPQGPEPVNLDQYRVRKQARIDGLINGYSLVA